MGARMRAHDWSRTPLGPVAGWPQSLRTIVSTCLNSRFPILIWWGPEMVKLYNDAYAAIVASKHPDALGRPGRAVWPEIWDLIGPMLDGVLTRGEATWSENILLPLVRHGFAEECYFTFSYSPIRDEGGGVGGIFTAVTETTGQVLSERRLRALRDLGERVAGSDSVGAVCDAAADVLRRNGADLPFSVLLLDAGDGAEPRVSATGLAAAPSPARTRRLLDSCGATLTVDELARALDGELVQTGELRATRAIVFPIGGGGAAAPDGLFVAGLSPRLVLEERYHDFLGLVAKQIGSALDTVRALEATRRRAEMLAEIDRAKTTFFSNVSHEFRTPLTLMLGPTEDALASGDGTLGRESVLSVHRNGLRLLRLVNALLDFARIEAGRVTASYQPTDLAALTADLASAFRSAIERAGLRFDVRCAPLPEPVHVDRDMWEKIVLNLLSNALKFTLSGDIAVELAPHDGGVRLSVRDTGAGIPAHELPRLFERFHRIEGTPSRTHEGSGIGLALVQELVRLHGGRISVESAVGQGSSFHVDVPLGTAHLPALRLVAAGQPARSTAAITAPFVEEALRWLPDDAQADDAAAIDGAAPSSDARILVADDNADMRDYLRRILSTRWHVDTVADGVAALAQARAQPPALVVTDVMMPNLDGFGLVRELRAGEATRRIPIVMLSARAGEEARVEGVESGADDYLVKPFMARELIARVDAQLARAKVRELEERHARQLTSVFQHAPVAIAILRGREHVFEFANARYSELVGHRDIVGKPIREALAELAGQGIFDLLDEVYRSGEPFMSPGLGVMLARGGHGASEECFFNFVYQPLRNEAGAVEGIVVVATEVTALARAQRDAESANRAKDEFLAILGHELRNPLAPILTALQIMRLRGGDADENARTIIDRQLKHLVRLVDDLLDVSRVTRGKIELEREPIEVAEVLAKAIEMTSPLLEQRTHQLTVDVPRRGLVVSGDATRLAQVFANLLTNAAKYTEPGGHIDVRAAVDAGGGEIVVTVRDSGVGISPEMLPRVFDLFVQERQELDRSQGGLGLGLAIVHSLVRLHGGSVGVRSDGRGRGSEFSVRLPRTELRVAERTSRAAAAAPVERPDHGQGRRVLVVDDNRDAADLLSESLGLLGFEVCVAYDGPSALEAADHFRPELALLDIGLPVMDGYEVARRLRDRAELRDLRLVALTGYGQESDRRRSRDAGFHAHLVKPLDLNALAALLERLAPSPSPSPTTSPATA